MIERRPTWRAVLAGAFFCATLPLSSPLAAQVSASDPILVENSVAAIRRSDYEAEVNRLPPDIRPGFANSERRVNDLLRRMLLERTLAEQARAEKLDELPLVAARLKLEFDRLYAQIKVAQIEEAAGAEFDAKRSVWEARAKETYTIDRKKYESPEMLQASHILFTTRSRSSDEARKLADEARARVVGGADFNAVAKEVSEDGSKSTGGRLDWFARAEVDRAFADAAFGLRDVGDVSQPVQSQFGWHVIRLDGRKPRAPRAYEDVRETIMSELRQKFVNEARDAAVGRLRADPSIRANAQAIDALVIRVDPDAVRRAREQQGGAAPR
jgi:peptidyl-prolyl cis-trans isomerase C